MTRSFLRFGESKRNKNKGKRSRQVPHRSFAAKPSRDLRLIKLWAVTLRMPEMEKA